jgi:hypothetical protein
MQVRNRELLPGSFSLRRHFRSEDSTGSAQQKSHEFSCAFGTGAFRLLDGLPFFLRDSLSVFFFLLL